MTLISRGCCNLVNCPNSTLPLCHYFVDCTDKLSMLSIKYPRRLISKATRLEHNVHCRQIEPFACFYGSVPLPAGFVGALEATFSILALRDGVVPHTLNLKEPHPTFGFTLVRDQPVRGSSCMVPPVISPPCSSRVVLCLLMLCSNARTICLRASVLLVL